LFDAELCSGIIDCNKLLSALHSRAGGGLCAEIVFAAQKIAYITSLVNDEGSQVDLKLARKEVHLLL